jgi:hypothetical protein
MAAYTLSYSGLCQQLGSWSRTATLLLKKARARGQLTPAPIRVLAPKGATYDRGASCRLTPDKTNPSGRQQYHPEQQQPVLPSLNGWIPQSTSGKMAWNKATIGEPSACEFLGAHLGSTTASWITEALQSQSVDGPPANARAIAELKQSANLRRPSTTFKQLHCKTIDLSTSDKRNQHFSFYAPGYNLAVASFDEVFLSRTVLLGSMR